jgi:arsenite methyltransferase
MKSTASVQEQVKEKYGSAARAVTGTGSTGSCCNKGRRSCDPITTDLYSAIEKGTIPWHRLAAAILPL